MPFEIRKMVSGSLCYREIWQCPMCGIAKKNKVLKRSILHKILKCQEISRAPSVRVLLERWEGDGLGGVYGSRP